MLCTPFKQELCRSFALVENAGGKPVCRPEGVGGATFGGLRGGKFNGSAVGDVDGNCTFDGGTAGNAGGNRILCIGDVDEELFELFAIGDNPNIVGRGGV